MFSSLSPRSTRGYLSGRATNSRRVRGAATAIEPPPGGDRRKIAAPSPLILTSLRFHLLPGPLRRRRHLLVALLAVELAVLAALVAAIPIITADDPGDGFAAYDTLLAEHDLPPGWIPVEAAAFPYMANSPLLTLLMEEETVAGAFSAYRDPNDSFAVATYVVFRPHDPLLLPADPDSGSLEKVTLLVIELERLARQRLDGALPNIYFAAADVPTAGALRGRSLTPPTGEGVQSDFVLFATGPVLAVVMVEHPDEEEPFRPVEELAQLVYSRIQEQLE